MQKLANVGPTQRRLWFIELHMYIPLFNVRLDGTWTDTFKYYEYVQSPKLEMKFRVHGPSWRKMLK